MALTAHRMRFPLSAADARRLHAGDQVLIDGEIVITAGMPTHERLLRCLDGMETAPMALAGASVFHLGSCSRDAGACLKRVSLTPATSSRFSPHTPRLARGFRWHAVGGKRGLDTASVDALQEVGGVYLSFLGGGCTLLSQAVREVLEV